MPGSPTWWSYILLAHGWFDVEEGKGFDFSFSSISSSCGFLCLHLGLNIEQSKCLKRQ